MPRKSGSITTIDSDFAWFPVQPGCRVITLRGLAEHAFLRDDGVALLALRCAGDVTPEQLAGSEFLISRQVGPFTYLRTLSATDRRIAMTVLLPEGVQIARIGIKTWNAVKLDVTDLAVELTYAKGAEPRPTPAPDPVGPQGEECWIAMTVDVEALPFRAREAHVQKLIWGESAAGRFGIPAQMELFRQFGVPATFLLDFGEGPLHGEAVIEEIGQGIIDSGFDLELHLHSEILIQAQKWRNSRGPRASFETLSYNTALRALTYGCERFQETAGRWPRLLRAGGFQFSSTTVDAAASLKIQGLSNVRHDNLANADAIIDSGRTGPFRWPQGPIELPVGLCPDPLSSLADPVLTWKRLLNWSQFTKVLPLIVIHSWSLTYRDKAGHHETASPEYRDSLMRFLDAKPPQIRFVSTGRILDHVARSTAPAPQAVA